METLTVFERVLHQIGASAGTTKSNIVHMANVVSLIGENGFIKSLLEEAKNAVKSIEGSDPKSQFMRRDLHFKCAKLGYEAFGLAAKVNPSDIEAVEKEPKIDVQACFVVPGDAEAAQKESESLTAQLDEVEKKCKDDTLADAQRVDVLKKSVSELSQKREALRRELESVERELARSEGELKAVEKRVAECTSRYAQKIESLQDRRDVGGCVVES